MTDKLLTDQRAFLTKLKMKAAALLAGTLSVSNESNFALAVQNFLIIRFF